MIDQVFLQVVPGLPQTIFNLFVIGLIRGSLYALIAAGIALIFGVANCSSFINGDLAMLGGYVGFFLTAAGINPIIALVGAASSLFVVGMFIEKSTVSPLRKRGEYGRWVLNTLIVSMGTSVVLQNAALILFGATFRGGTFIMLPGSITFLGVTLSADRIITFILSLVIISVFIVFLRYAKLGRALRCVSADEEGAELVGINRDRMYTLAFGLSSAISGIGGFLLIPIFALYPTVGSTTILVGWVILIMGGVGNVKGAIVCSLILGLVQSFAIYLLGSGWQNVILFVMVMAILIVKPSGLFGMGVKGIWEKPH